MSTSSALDLETQFARLKIMGKTNTNVANLEHKPETSPAMKAPPSWTTQPPHSSMNIIRKVNRKAKRKGNGPLKDLVCWLLDHQTGMSRKPADIGPMLTSLLPTHAASPAPGLEPLLTILYTEQASPSVSSPSFSLRTFPYPRHGHTRPSSSRYRTTTPTPGNTLPATTTSTSWPFASFSLLASVQALWNML